MKTLKALMVCLVTITGICMSFNAYAYTLEVLDRYVQTYSAFGQSTPTWGVTDNNFMVAVKTVANTANNYNVNDASHLHATIIIRNDDESLVEKNIAVTAMFNLKRSSEGHQPVIQMNDTVTGALLVQKQFVATNSVSTLMLKSNHPYSLHVSADVIPRLGGSATASVAFTLPFEVTITEPSVTVKSVPDNNRCTGHYRNDSATDR